MLFLDEFFEKEGIECYSVLAYSDCRESAPRIMQREPFTPKSVIIFLVPYFAGVPKNISRYAASRDYHLYIKDVTERLAKEIKAHFPTAMAKGYGDHSPIDERSAALVAGLGILGDNGLLINEKYGSYVFIADLVTDIDPSQLCAKPPREVRFCEHCGTCKRACPTGILRGEGDDCLSAITQKKGELSDSEAELMREYNTAWGCDICQSICPHNRTPLKTPIKFFLTDRVEELDEKTLSAMTDEQFSSRAFAWRGRKTVERNIEILSKCK